MRRDTLAVLAAVLIMTAGLPAIAEGDPSPAADRVVHPTGQWPDDVQNVQAAVDGGGIVLLKATDASGSPAAFNFGPSEGTVCGKQIGIERDVWLIGESSGGAATTITGGFRPILVGIPSGGWCAAGGFASSHPRVRVEGITFNGALQAAIDVYKSRQVEIVRNRILNVKTAFGLGIGTNIFGGGSQRRVAGKVTIAENLVRFSAVEGGFVHGILLDNVAADVDIVRNTVENTQDFTGIIVVRQVEGRVRIADNLVTPNAEVPGQGGIGIYIYANDRWNAVRTSPPVYEVVGNRVVTEGEVGIGLVGQRGSIDGALIERNHISRIPAGRPGDPCTACESGAGLSLGGNIFNVRIAANRIDGGGLFAIELFEFEPAQSAEGNVFLGNNLTQFDTREADLFLGAHTRMIMFMGNARTVTDLGTDNEITGASSMRRSAQGGPAIGRRKTDEPPVTAARP